MKKIFIMIAVLLVGGVLASCDFIFPKTWNYKITIEVETPEGVKTGATVRQIRARQELAGYINPSAGLITYDVIGEAVVVDLGERGLLFGLIEDTDYIMLEQAFGKHFGNNPSEHMDYFANIPVGTNAELRKKMIPFVTFTNIKDPKSIKGAGSKVMSEVFGKGVSLKKVVIEITDEPITWGNVRKYLEWYDRGRMGLNYQEIKQLRRNNNNNIDSAKFYTKEKLIRGER